MTQYYKKLAMDNRTQGDVFSPEVAIQRVLDSLEGLNTSELNKKISKLLDDEESMEVEGLFESIVEKYAKKLLQNNKLAALWRAVKDNNLDIAEQFLKNGVKPNLNDAEGGYYKLVMAVSYDYKEMAKLLLRYRSNPNIVDEMGKSVLMLAVENDSTELVKSLLQHKADLAYANPWDGKTALSIAEEVEDNTKMVNLIKSYPETSSGSK